MGENGDDEGCLQSEGCVGWVVGNSSLEIWIDPSCVIIGFNCECAFEGFEKKLWNWERREKKGGEREGGMEGTIEQVLTDVDYWLWFGWWDWGDTRVREEKMVRDLMVPCVRGRGWLENDNGKMNGWWWERRSEKGADGTYYWWEWIPINCCPNLPPWLCFKQISLYSWLVRYTTRISFHQSAGRMG